MVGDAMRAAYLLWALVLFPCTVNAQLATQSSTERGVTVVVTPGSLESDLKVWEFAVALDARREPLVDELTESAVLVDDEGHAFKPLLWRGSAPGGRHRAGVLTFESLGKGARTLELRIRRPGEGKPRVFRWQLLGPIR
jgi:hypothetical protein